MKTLFLLLLLLIPFCSHSQSLGRFSLLHYPNDTIKANMLVIYPVGGWIDFPMYSYNLEQRNDTLYVRPVHTIFYGSGMFSYAYDTVDLGQVSQSVNVITAEPYFIDTSGFSDDTFYVRPAKSIRLRGTGITEVVHHIPIKPAPNPVSNYLLFSLTAVKNQTIVVLVHDQAGHRIAQRSHAVSAGRNEIRVSMEALPPGTYTISCRVDDKAYAGKVVKE